MVQRGDGDLEWGWALRLERDSSLREPLKEERAQDLVPCGREGRAGEAVQLLPGELICRSQCPSGSYCRSYYPVGKGKVAIS